MAAVHLSDGRRLTGGLALSAKAQQRAQIGLVAATIVVDALAPLLQERASRAAGFESSFMVLAETSTYFLGGLSLSVAVGGMAGLRRCVRPARYLAFLPASAAFSSSNFLTYVAVRGLGASQFYLLAQLRILILAVAHRVRSGVSQPTPSWLALVQLAVGVVVLVWYKANNPPDCAVAVAAALQDAANGGTVPGGQAVPWTAISEDPSAVSARAEFVLGFFALIGVVLTSAFGFLYLEWQLKLHAQDPIYVQLHQMNSCGMMAALLIYATQHHHAAPHHAAAVAAPLGRMHLINHTAQAAAVGGAAPEDGQGPSVVQAVMLLTCIVSRGVLSGSVLKRLDSIAKGLIDVTAIVICTFLQILIDPGSANGTVLGIQSLMLLSIVSYQQVRTPTPANADTVGAKARHLQADYAPKLL